MAVKKPRLKPPKAVLCQFWTTPAHREKLVADAARLGRSLASHLRMLTAGKPSLTMPRA